MDFALSRGDGLRRQALKSVHGSVLEVGFGTGLNLPCYPPAIEKLVALDVARMLPARVETRIAKTAFSVQQEIIALHEPFPFRDEEFDCVVTTFTLCSVRAAENLLREIQRVMRAGGVYLFLEHGRAFDDHTAARQRRLNWLSSLLANGCRLDVPIPAVIREAGFNIVRLERFIDDRTVRVAGYMYQGMARKGSIHQNTSMSPPA
jgi:SAM-dependent methyltransferase